MSYNRPDLDLVDSSFFLASSKIFVGLSESPLAFQFKTLTTQFAILLNGDLITSSSHVFTNFESMSLQKKSYLTTCSLLLSKWLESMYPIFLDKNQ